MSLGYGFGWNYPPGVSGNEYEIAGPDSTWEDKHFCDTCDKWTQFDCESFNKLITGVCRECEEPYDLGEFTKSADPDRENDEKEDYASFREERGLD